VEAPILLGSGAAAAPRPASLPCFFYFFYFFYFFRALTTSSAPLFGGPFDGILVSAPHHLGDLD
jgi:hypothetical protein